MADWKSFAQGVARRLQSEPEVTLSIEEVIRATGSSNRSLHTRSFWASVRRGDATKAFQETGIEVLPQPSQRGKELRAITFRSVGAECGPTTKVVIAQPSDVCLVMTEARFRKVSGKYACVEEHGVSTLVARVVEALGDSKVFPGVEEARRWLESLGVTLPAAAPNADE